MSANAVGDAMWRLVTQGPAAPLPGDGDAARRWAARLAALVTPAFAAHLLGETARPSAARLLDEAAVAESRLLARFKLEQQRRWVRAIAGHGIEAVYLKGYAAGIALYGDAALRTQGDLDLLVREGDLDALVSFLAGQGFRFFRPQTHRWGMISDASFLPFVSPDGECNIDIHVQPDCYPAYLSLTAERVFAAARRVDDGAGETLLTPAPEHAMALCVTNAAKDKFDLFALRKAIDAATMLRAAHPLDWDEVLRLARDGRYLKPARVFFCLLQRLGAPTGAVPPTLLRPPGGPAAPVFARVLRDFQDLFVTRPSMAELLLREATICAEPGVALHNAGLRLRGLLRPHTGLPAGTAGAAVSRPE